MSDERTDRQKAKPEEKFKDILYVLEISLAGSMPPEFAYGKVKEIIER